MGNNIKDEERFLQKAKTNTKYYAINEEESKIFANLAPSLLNDLKVTERPDFYSEKYGIAFERFEVSFYQSGKHGDLGRPIMQKRYRNFDQKTQEKFEETGESVVEVESFSYSDDEGNNFVSEQNFLDNLDRSIKKHYRNISTYKEETGADKIAFVIEMGTEAYGFKVSLNADGLPDLGRHNSDFPAKMFLTEKVQKILQKYPEVDFWIFFHASKEGMEATVLTPTSMAKFEDYLKYQNISPSTVIQTRGILANDLQEQKQEQK